MIAIILAGGRGSRLTPWHAPKSLIPINGETILNRLMHHLEDSGIHGFVVCAGYRSGDIAASLDAHCWSPWIDGKGVKLSDAGLDATMGERLLKVKADLNINERALICYGDELSDVDIGALVAQHEGAKSSLTFTTAMQKTSGGQVIFGLSDDGGVRIIEGAPLTVNIGFVVVEPEMWSYLHSLDGLSDWINRVSSETKNVGIYRHKGKRATVNSLADLAHAEEVWRDQ